MVEAFRGSRNRTINLSPEERQKYSSCLLQVNTVTSLQKIKNTTIYQDIFVALPLLKGSAIDLLFIDPPYNLTKSFNGRVFKQRDLDEYADWFDNLLKLLFPLLSSNASIYVCGDWRSSAALHYVLERYFIVRNRITWEREKGRGALTNWKNCSEDIWFCTVSDNYVFNVDAVKLKRKVIAPYKENGKPKDWEQTEEGDFRLTHPSNLWTDLTIPFWSMPENTEHPTQKPEKLLAKIILASSLPGQLVFDPFLGSGTTSVVAKKLGRSYIGIEADETYCCLAEKRLQMAEKDASIQGYTDGVFWERNSLVESRTIPAIPVNVGW